MHLSDITSHIFEEEAKPASHPPATPQPPPQPTVIVNNAAPYVPTSDAVVATSADRSDEAYQKLLARTDFTKTAVYQTLQKFLTPLTDVIPDERTRFKAAVKQATAQGGFAPESIVAAFDQIRADLQHAADSFGESVKQAIATQVEAKKAKAADLAQQAQALQTQSAQLSDDAFATQQKIDAGQHRFDTAFQTRQQEITQEQAKYTSLLS